MPAVTTIVLGTLVGASLLSARKGRKQQKAASQIQQKSARLKSQRDSVEQLRVAQVQRANITQQAESSGVGDSSSVAGARGSLQSQAGGNIAFAQTLFELSQQASARLSSAAGHFQRSQAYAQLATFDVGGAMSQNGSPAPVTTSVPSQ